jgi:hypothetical protein
MILNAQPTALSMKFSVLERLCQINREIDRIAQKEGRRPAMPKIKTNSISHHAYALAGILRRTGRDQITLTVNGIIVEVRRN